MTTGNALATILLVSHLCAEGVEPLKAPEFWRICDLVGPPEVLLGAVGPASVGVPADLAARVTGLLARATALAFELDRLQQAGIATITPFDGAYPLRLRPRLGARAPALLHVAGDVAVLARGGLGVVGTAVDDASSAVAAQAGARAAALGLPVIAGQGGRGGSDGSDHDLGRHARQAALDAGGVALGVLAGSLTAALEHAGVRGAVRNGRLVLCTPYAPDAADHPRQALGQERLVHALSTVTLVVAADPAGALPTWAAATEALTNDPSAVVVWRGPGEGAGNHALTEQGATELRSIDQLDEIVAARSPPAAPSPRDDPDQANPATAWGR